MTLPCNINGVRVSFKDASNLDTTRPIPIAITALRQKGPAWLRPLYRLREALRYLIFGDQVNAWVGDGHMFSTEDMAQRTIDYANTQTEKGRDEARRRMDANAIVGPTLIDQAEKDEWVCYGEVYAEGIEELLERFEDGEMPCYCHPAPPIYFHFDLEAALESYLDDEHHEDAEVDDLNQLMAFYKAWSEKQTLTSYFEDPKRIIVIDPLRFEALHQEARAVLAELGQ